MKSPFESFLVDALRDFEKELKRIGMEPTPAKSRLRGARQFAQFLLG